MRSSTVTTDRGRTLEIAEVGAPDGRPVLVLHGTPSSVLVLEHLAAAADRAGARLVSFSRPGYGASPPAGAGLAAGGLDAVAVLDALGIEAAPVVGISGGGPFAAAAGVVGGGSRVPAVCLLAGTGRTTDLMGELPPEEVEIAGLVESGRTDDAVAAVRAQAEAMLGRLVGRPGDEIFAAFRQLLPPNEGRGGPDFARWMAADLGHALGSLDGFVTDNVSWGYRWDIDPGHLTQPVLLRYGGADAMVPPAHGTWWKERIPHAELVVVDGEGHGDTSFGRMDDALAWLRT
jgi:pimeloyl-ACP methyl ester carboxylesterase